jgi:pimeloyl-ACP methyl ester carboxylesterase
MKYDILCAVVVFSASFAISANGQGLAAGAVEDPVHAACVSPSQPVHEDRFIPVGGAEQWVTIHGDSCANPVILFLHGGPGNTLSPYADAVYGTWARRFTLVQWDQPGAARTFGRSVVSTHSTLTLERIAQDGIALAQYLTRHLGKKKIILLGGSWGSILGVHLVKARPDLFYAYVGVSQVVSYRENLTASYAKLMEMARTKRDQSTISTLETMGQPPWVNPRNFGILRRLTRAYESLNSTPGPQSWWVRAPQYNNAERIAEYEAGEDFSYLQFVGLVGEGMFSRVDLTSLGLDFEVPVFMIHGAHDLVAIPEVARSYFDDIRAPQKEMLLVPHAGHDPNEALVDAQYRVIHERVLPLTQ